MKRLFIVFGALFALLFSSGVALASMRHSFGPMNIEGVIETISWTPDQFIKAKGIWSNGQWCPASGTLGRDRIRRAHYRITLIDTKVESRPANHSQSYTSGEVINICIPHPANDGSLKKGMRIRITDYTFRGDEGGDWYSFSSVSIHGSHRTLYPERHP
jgi:hypothetical protein